MGMDTMAEDVDRKETGAMREMTGEAEIEVTVNDAKTTQQVKEKGTGETVPVEEVTRTQGGQRRSSPFKAVQPKDLFAL